jgi:hypothetical protein
MTYYLFAAPPVVTTASPRDQLCDRFALPLPLYFPACGGVYGRRDAPDRFAYYIKCREMPRTLTAPFFVVASHGPETDC